MAGINHAPPPFFKQGPAPLALLIFYIAISLALFVVDLRFRSLELLRQSVALIIDPVQRVAQTPGSLVDHAATYLQGLHNLQQENSQLKHAQLNTAPNLPEPERKPACVLACPANARLFGDVHDPESVVSQAIAEHGGYQLMPEWGTRPANHYLPRRKTEIRIHPEDLERVDNPRKIDSQPPEQGHRSPGREDFAT